MDRHATITIAPGLAAEATADLADLKAHLSAVVTDARGRWQAETDEVSAAVAALEAPQRGSNRRWRTC